MAHPVTGPYTKYVDQGVFMEKIVGYRQKRPYNIINPMELERATTFPEGRTEQATRAIIYARDVRDTRYGVAYDAAYAKLVSKLGENAGIGINLAQWKQSDSMIRNRANQLGSFTSALVRRNPLGIAASLGISARQARKVLNTKYGVARNLSDLWLEFWFGWKPLVSDIYTACEALQEPLPKTRIRGRASQAMAYGFDYNAPATEYFVGSATCQVRLGCDVVVSNPNTRLLQQMGLLNPAVVVWDAIPWSFVIDWFWSVSAVLNAFTDFAGLTVSNAYIVKIGEVKGHWKWHPCEVCTQAQKDVYLSRKCSMVAIAKSRQPLTSFPSPSLRYKGLNFSPTRALTAISLLTQKLPKA